MARKKKMERDVPEEHRPPGRQAIMADHERAKKDIPAPDPMDCKPPSPRMAAKLRKMKG